MYMYLCIYLCMYVYDGTTAHFVEQCDNIVLFESTLNLGCHGYEPYPYTKIAWMWMPMMYVEPPYIANKIDFELFIMCPMS